MADLVIAPANVAIADGAEGRGAQTQKVLAGEVLTQGEPCYLNTADGKYYRAVATTAATAAAAGIVLTPAKADGYCVIIASGPMNLGATLAVGETYYVSATSGGIMPSADVAAGNFVTKLGIAIDPSRIDVAIDASGTAKV